MSAECTAFFRQGCGKQHGAALMVMLVIMIIGAAAILVSALSSSSLQIERDKTTADALAKARNALIAYAVSDPNRPGELPCPDFNNDGASVPIVDYNGSSCQSLVGWLPWKTLGLPDLRDGNGDRLWYAVANPFHANGAATFTLNSDTPTTYQSQMLTVQDGATGSTLQTNVVAVVFSSGTVLSGQIRSTNDNNATNAITNYLEGSNANPTSVITQTANNTTINDRLLTIGSNELMAPVEMRIAREAKRCLDNYAASNTYKRYPWAVPDTYPSTNQTGVYSTLFGRIAATPLTTTQPIDSTASTMLTALSSLQIALNNYSANVNATTTSALLSAGQTLATAAGNADNNPGTFQPYNYLTDQAQNAGTSAQNLANGGSSVSTVQNYVNSTNSSLISNNFIDGSMPIYWPSGCVFTSTYWNAWQNEIFYQLASADRPGSGLSACNTSCLSITGSGNPNSGSGSYSAAVIVGRAHNASGSLTSNPPSYYLEGSNLHNSNQTYFTSPQLSQTFVTYNPGDPNFSSVNDLVLCLDGNNNCK